MLPELHERSIMVMSAREQVKQIYLSLLTALKRLIAGRRNPPEDPYSYVTAPKKPRPPHLSAAAVADRPEE
jgi:hypothetical protein